MGNFYKEEFVDIALRLDKDGLPITTKRFYWAYVRLYRAVANIHIAPAGLVGDDFPMQEVVSYCEQMAVLCSNQAVSDKLVDIFKLVVWQCCGVL